MSLKENTLAIAFTGKRLENFIETKTKELTPRFPIAQIHNYINEDNRGKVCIIYGIKRTGKTTLMAHALKELPSDVSAYIDANEVSKTSELKLALEDLANNGFKYIFIDEVTKLKDFIERSSLYPDRYASEGIKVILSGTDSSKFLLAEMDGLFDRAVKAPTTRIPYNEQKLVLHTKNILDVIRRGSFSADTLFPVGVSNYSNYLLTVLVSNLENGLHYKSASLKYPNLKALYDTKEFPSYFNRVVEDDGHKFIEEVFLRDFESLDISQALTDLDKPEATTLLDTIDLDNINEVFRNSIGIANVSELNTSPTPQHYNELEDFLLKLDIIKKLRIDYEDDDDNDGNHYIFTVTGFRWAQVEILINILENDNDFKRGDRKEQQEVIDKLRSIALGRLFEEFIQLETTERLSPGMDVFKFKFSYQEGFKPGGEFDMVIMNNIGGERVANLYEIKLTDRRGDTKSFAKHLMDEKKVEQFKELYSTEINEKVIIYNGPSFVHESGIIYKNADEFVMELPNFTLDIQQGPKP